MKEFRLYKSPRKAIKLLLGSAVFVALGCYLLGRPGVSQFGAWMTIGFFGLGLLISCFQFFDRRPQIIVNDVGVFDRTMHHEFINWEIIRDAYLVQMQKQMILCLVVDEVFEPSRRKNRFKQRVASLNKEFGFQELNMPLGFVDIDAFRFAEFILAMRGAAPPDREVLVKKAIANL